MTRHTAPETESTRTRERDAYRDGPWVDDHHGRHNGGGN